MLVYLERTMLNTSALKLFEASLKIMSIVRLLDENCVYFQCRYLNQAVLIHRRVFNSTMITHPPGPHHPFSFYFPLPFFARIRCRFHTPHFNLLALKG
ncbi:hypothetical protein Peur_055275 [Populus x canadensis]